MCPSTPLPIAIGSGNKHLTVRDIESGGVSFDRSYNSQSAVAGYTTLITGSPTGAMPLGAGWTTDYQQQVRFASGSTTTWVTRPSGRVFTFQLSGTNRNPEADVTDRLTELKDAGGTRTGWRYWDAQAQRAETYDASGKLQTVSERDGRVRSVLYSDGTDGLVSGNGGFVLDASGNPTTTVLPAGRLLKVVDALGQRLLFGYDASGRIVKLSNAAGNTVRYAYDAAGNLVSVTYPDSSVRTYQYNEAAYTGGSNLPGALTGITDENGVRHATYQYDASGRAIGEYLAGGADTASLSYTQDINQNVTQTAVTDALGTARTYTFSTQFGVTRSTGVSQHGVSQPGGPGCGASSSAITYDGNANVASRTDFAGNKTCYGNDLTRNLETTRIEGLASPTSCPDTSATLSPDSPIRKVSTQWHPLWRLPVREAQPKKITTWVYNGQPDPTAGGAIASCAPADAYVYDTVPIAVLCKQVEQPTTDINGGTGFTAAPDGTARIWSYTWNRYGQMLTADGPRTDVSDVTTYEYYPDTTTDWTQGDLKKITNPLGQTWLFTKYDRAGRLLSMTDANNAVTQQTWTPRGWLETQSTLYALSTFSYDPTGLLKKLVRFDYSTLDFEYDAAHRLTSVTDTVGNRVEYTLDAAGNILQTDLFKPDLSLSRQQRIEFDALGRPWRQRNAAGQVTERWHDAMGRINKLIDAKNHVTDYQWDALGRLKEIDDAQQPDRGVTRAQFNGQDNLISLTASLTASATAPSNAVTQFAVNGLGDVTQEVSSDRGTLNYTYDAAGNVTRRTDALGRVTDYTWDALNRLLSATFRPGMGATPTETINYTWDISANCQWGAGHLCRVTDGAGISEYSYTPFGHLVSDMRTEAGLTHRADFFKDARGLPMSSSDSTGLYTYPARTGAGEILWVDFEFSSGELPQEGLRITGYDADGQMVGLAIGPRYELSDVLSSSRAFNLDGQVVDTLVIQSLVGLDLHWQTIYAPVGQPVSLTVTVSPLEARGMLLLCKDPVYYTPCDGDARLGEVAVTGGGVYTLQTFDTVPLGVYSASVRFIGADLVPSRGMYERQPIFIGVPPTSLIGDFLQ